MERYFIYSLRRFHTVSPMWMSLTLTHEGQTDWILLSFCDSFGSQIQPIEADCISSCSPNTSSFSMFCLETEQPKLPVRTPLYYTSLCLDKFCRFSFYMVKALHFVFFFSWLIHFVIYNLSKWMSTLQM